MEEIGLAEIMGALGWMVIGGKLSWVVFVLMLVIAFEAWLNDPRIMENIWALVLVGLLLAWETTLVTIVIFF